MKITDEVKRILNQHRRQIEGSPAVDGTARLYALDLVDDIESDLEAVRGDAMKITDETQAMAVPIKDQANRAREHYEELAMKACNWSSIIPQAIDAWEREKEAKAMKERQLTLRELIVKAFDVVTPDADQQAVLDYADHLEAALSATTDAVEGVTDGALKPCPFCGREPHVVETAFQIGCYCGYGEDTDGEGAVWRDGKTFEQVRDRWNRRVIHRAAEEGR